MKKEVLGLSGGVDSALAAALLKEQGYDVLGLYIDFGFGSPEDAQRVAREMGISFAVADRRQALQDKVCRYFIEEYRRGRTPNPCVVCNPLVKFRTLLDVAEEAGAQCIATGHYAQTGEWGGKHVILAAESPKDQSYMLCRLTQEMADRVRFPLGGYPDKTAVRRDAARYGIPIADKADSMDVCFIPDGDYGNYLARSGVRLPKGQFVLEDGTVLGEHRGIQHYTVGQRKGLGVAAEGRLFVHRIDPARNQVVLSFSDVFRKEVEIQNVSTIDPMEFQREFDAEIKVRYSKKSQRGRVIPRGRDGVIVFEEPVRAPAPGQSAVFYDGRRLIGGGFIR